MGLFTDRYGQGLPRTKEELDNESREALWGLLTNRIEEEWLGFAFPSQCGDGYVYAGTAITVFSARWQHIGFSGHQIRVLTLLPLTARSSTRWNFPTNLSRNPATPA